MFSSKKTYIQNCTGSHLKHGEKSAGAKSIDKMISKIIFYFLLVGFLGISIYVLFFSTYLNVSNIIISGNNELSLEDLKKVVENGKQGKYFGIIPKDNFLLIRSDKVKQLLSGDFRKIKEVSVSKRFPDTLMISLQERKALLVLCSGENCFLIDENGIAYSQADFSSPELTQNHLIRISDKSLGEIKIGEEVATQAYIQYVLKLKDSLQNIGLVVEDEFWTPSLVADEINVKVRDGQELYFSTQFSLESAIKTLDIILKKEPLKTQQKDTAYIDLRTENKVFYKLNNQPATDNTENKQ